jgi:hypothetical protein
MHKTTSHAAHTSGHRQHDRPPSREYTPPYDVDREDRPQHREYMPPIDVDREHSLPLIETIQSPTRPVSPEAGSKRQHNSEVEENDSDLEEEDVHISKIPKIERKTVRPKASDFDDIGKELVLASANRYRALLASQDAFPNPSKELKLVKKSWKLANAESGMKSLSLTPSIVKIVSNFLLHAYDFLYYLCF